VNAPGQKRSWEKPQLIVLVRIDLGESLLQGCKLTTAFSGASNARSRCYTDQWGNACWGDCSQQRGT